MPDHRSTLCAALLAVASGTLPAQNVLVVGPGGFPQIADAITAAAPGDTVLVRGGSYLPFTLRKGLIIRAVPGERVEVSNLFINAVTAIDTPPRHAPSRPLRRSAR